MYFNIPLYFIVASLTSTSLGVVTARRSFDIVLARQATSGPPECKPICNYFSAMVSPEKCGTNSTSPACICTDENKEALQACVNCAVGDDPALTGQFSALINDWKAVCNSDISLPSATPNTAGTTPQSTPNTAGVGDTSGTTRDISHD